jgi:hypothetical protein
MICRTFKDGTSKNERSADDTTKGIQANRRYWETLGFENQLSFSRPISPNTRQDKGEKAFFCLIRVFALCPALFSVNEAECPIHTEMQATTLRQNNQTEV